MTKHIDLPYLNYILDVIKDIEISIDKISKEKFLKNTDIRDANIRRLEVISESIKDLSVGLKDQYRNINWERLIIVKNVIKNQYFGVDLEVIWEVLKNSIPELKEQILKMKKDLENKEI